MTSQSLLKATLWFFAVMLLLARMALTVGMFSLLIYVRNPLCSVLNVCRFDKSSLSHQSTGAEMLPSDH